MIHWSHFGTRYTNLSTKNIVFAHDKPWNIFKVGVNYTTVGASNVHNIIAKTVG